MPDGKQGESTEDQEREGGIDTQSDNDARGDGEGKGEEPLGPKGLKALADERKRADDAEAELKRIKREQDRIERDRATKAGDFEALSKTQESEIGELRTRIAELEGQIAERDTAIVRGRVAAKHKLPERLAARVQGATEAEMEADARELAKLILPPKAAETEAGRGNGQGGGKHTIESEKQAQLATGRYGKIA